VLRYLNLATFLTHVLHVFVSWCLLLGHEQTWILVSKDVTLHHLVSSLYVLK